MPSTHRVASLSDIPDGDKLGVKIGDTEIVLFRSDGAIYGYEDSCPHQGIPLSEAGTIRGQEILCVMHGAAFNLSTGELVASPAPCGLRPYRTRIEGNDVFIDLP